MKRSISIVVVLTAIAAAAGAGSAWSGEIVIGLQCDRTGPTQIVGNIVCPAYHDYVKLINANGGIGGHTIRVMEVDHQYKVTLGVESYQRFKAAGAVLIGLYGTPQTQALTSDLIKDKIPGTSPGFGTAAAADGQKYPYLFPMAASYWSQAAGAVEFVRQELGGSLDGKKIAYVYYDNPAGREGLPVLRALSESEGFELREFAVPAPGLEMSAQVRDIARRYRADYVISHLFGRAPSVQLKEFNRAGYPLDKVVSFVWGASEADIAAAGGWDAAEGYNGISFAGVGPDYPVLGEIAELYRAKGDEPPEVMKYTVFYNRGVLMAGLHLEAITNAVEANGGGSDVTGTQVKAGFETIENFTLGGLVPPLRITPIDHEGGGLVRVFQVKGGKWIPRTDWYQGYRDTVLELLAEEG
ncbi:MAG: ABC transporter substrate-binding protein [Alphaproteobacteria bacterium]|jgi:branched-chain amino acid transport system substrate-binding protein|nr:ABC transporter substrate-binding protein [Alphaproteobacteria bacterium]MDP6515444.1 ABC transporter substrate-binding protein [Alphaproteobacteria bacterium]